MNIYIVVLVIVTIVAILSLIFFSSINKLKKYKERIQKAESIIDTNLDKKLNLIISINGEIKKVIKDKDYLKDYISIKDLIMTNIEKDARLNEASKLINNLMIDYSKLNTNEKLKKQINELKQIDEKLTSVKNVFNTNALLSNNLIKTFPNNIVAKISNYKIRSYYNNNKTEDMDSF